MFRSDPKLLKISILFRKYVENLEQARYKSTIHNLREKRSLLKFSVKPFSKGLQGRGRSPACRRHAQTLLGVNYQNSPADCFDKRVFWQKIPLSNGFEHSCLAAPRRRKFLKATPHKDRLKALHQICLHIFRHSTQNSLEIR